MKPEAQRVRWTSHSFTVVDADQTIAFVQTVLKMTPSAWVVVYRRDDQETFWYVFSSGEFRRKLKSASPLKKIRDVIELSESGASDAVPSRRDKVTPRSYVKDSEPQGRVVLVDRKTNRVNALGIVPTYVANMTFGARKSSGAARARGNGLRGEAFKKAVKKAAGRPDGGFAVKYAAKKAAKKSRAFQAYAPAQTVSKVFDVVQVLFATDRKLSRSEAGTCKFSNRRCDDDELRYGSCDVSIPKSHKVGDLESPSWLRLQFRYDPAKHVSIIRTDVISKNRFVKTLRGRVAASSHKDALIFIHGYNVSFEDGARRTAQIAHDLKFQGAPILYSWPSRASLLHYAADAASVDLSAGRFRQFLLTVAQESGAKTLHVIAHSMGNRALLLALEQLAMGTARPTIHNVILTAPDIDAERFKQIAATIRHFPVRTTLYASSKDKALRQSKHLYKAPRAGESGKDIVVVTGVDTVDASTVDTNIFSLGHSYFGNKRSVLRDVNELLQGKPPNSRFELCAQTSAEGMYWAFKA